MNRILTISAVILLLIGAVAIAVIKVKPSDDADDSSARASGSRATPAGTTSSGGSGPAPKSAERSPREVRDAELADRYGESKTKLSRQVAGNVVTLLEDVISMGETMRNSPMRGNFGGGRMAARMALRGIDIELTEEQQNQVAELYQAFQDREMEKAKDAVGALQKDPTALMELFLAGDAKAREEMTEAEYEAVVSSAASDLTDVINPLDRNNFRGGRPMEDETFRRDFEAILDEDQASTLNTTLAEREAEQAASDDPAADDGNITNIPTMELETLDDAVNNAQKMTSGFKQVMEGLGGLQDLRPQIEPEGTPDE